MESNIFSIDKKTRTQTSSGTRIYRIISGSIVFILGVAGITKPEFSTQFPSKVFSELFILTGIMSVVYGSVGKELFKDRYRLIMNSDSLRIKRWIYSDLAINLNSITHLKILPLKLEISFKDYMKTYDFSWLSINEFEDFRIRISDYCLKKNIEIAN